MVGALIRQLRMERNYSQAGLAHGICAASYLSKIEQGQAEASPEILDRLFAALGVTYCRDPLLLSQAEERLSLWFETWDQEEDGSIPAAWLDARLEQLLFSDLCLTVRIYQICRMQDTQQARLLLSELKHSYDRMTMEQRYRYLLAADSLEPDPQVSLDLLQQAARCKSCGHIWLQIAHVCYHIGSYSRCIEHANRAYSLAAEEGDLHVLIGSSYLLGTCYTDRDLDAAERYYRRAIRLGKTTRPQLLSMAAYNLGASCLEWGKPEKAVEWLERSDLVPDAFGHNLLLEQKRGLAYLAVGRPEDAAHALARAETFLSELQHTQSKFCCLYQKMLLFARLLLERQEHTPAFEQVTSELYHQTGHPFGFGFRRFYGLYLVRYYRSQRRYKDALQIMEDIQDRIS